jgi:two-component system, NarL family, invasion response regulator UvrY
MTKVLVVDDSDAVRRSVHAALDAMLTNATIGEAASAAGALARVDAEDWDLVVLDLSLPDRSGIDTLRTIRARHPALPVLVMSFHPEAAYGAAVRAAGAVGYLVKGSSADVMAEAVRSALAAGELTASSR